MNPTQKKTLWTLAVIGLVYFLAFIPVNLVGSENTRMLSIFEVDENAQYRYPTRMVKIVGAEDWSPREFISYRHYYYGFPFYISSFLAIFPLKILSLQLNNDALYSVRTIMLVMRQMVSVFPMVLALLVMTYSLTRFKNLSKAILLFIFLLLIPGVVKNNFWWHPDSITFFFIALTFLFLDLDDLSFGKYFYLAAAACGFASGTKLLGLFFFIAIPTYIAWGYFNHKIELNGAVKHAFGFVTLMVISFFIADPQLLYKSEWDFAVYTQQIQADAMAVGWTVAYDKGPQAWFPEITKYYGTGIAILTAYAVVLAGAIRGPRKRFNTLILTWAIPFSLYLFYFIAIKPAHFYLTIAIPVYAGAVANLSQWLRPDDTDKQPNTQTHRTGALIAAVILIVQLGMNAVWAVENYEEELHRERDSESIAFYNQLKVEFLDKIPPEESLIVIRDRAMYIPHQNGWEISGVSDLIDYQMIAENNYDLILVYHQRIMDYTQPNTLEIAKDKEAMERAHIFFADVLDNNVEGYILLFKTDFGYAFASESLYQEYLQP